MKNKLLIEKLEANNCEIILDKAESLFLTEEIVYLLDNSKLSVNNINKLLEVFRENNDIRYYSYNDINQISKNLYNYMKKKVKNEALGRNFSTQKGVLSTINDQGSISPEKLAVSLGWDKEEFFNEEDNDDEENFVTTRNILTKIIVNEE